MHKYIKLNEEVVIMKKRLLKPMKSVDMNRVNAYSYGGEYCVPIDAYCPDYGCGIKINFYCPGR